MSCDALLHKRQNEPAQRLQELADAALQQVSLIADREALSLPAREQFYEFISMELLLRADACRP